MRSTLHCHCSQVHSDRSGSNRNSHIYRSNRTKQCNYAKLNGLKFTLFTFNCMFKLCTYAKLNIEYSKPRRQGLIYWRININPGYHLLIMQILDTWNNYRMQIIFLKYFLKRKWCSRGVMVKALDWGIVVSEIELRSRYYVHFWTNTLILQAMS